MNMNQSTDFSLLRAPFPTAVRDYLYLLNHGYPDRESLKLVANHHRLNRFQRSMLYRGICPTSTAETRKQRLIQPGNIKGKIKDEIEGEINMDGYNVFLTVMNHLLGKPVFIGNDGIMRDVGETYGNIENQHLFRRAVRLTTTCLAGLPHPTPHVLIYLDRSVPNGEQHRVIIDEEIRRSRLGGETIPVPNADHTLIQELTHKKKGILSTSDSAIIDATPCHLLDTPRHTLEQFFKKKTNIIHLLPTPPSSQPHHAPLKH